MIDVAIAKPESGVVEEKLGKEEHVMFPRMGDNGVHLY